MPPSGRLQTVPTATYEVRRGNDLVATRDNELSAIEAAKDAARRTDTVHGVWLVSPERDVHAELLYHAHPSGVVTAPT